MLYGVACALVHALTSVLSLRHCWLHETSTDFLRFNCQHITVQGWLIRADHPEMPGGLS